MSQSHADALQACLARIEAGEAAEAVFTDHPELRAERSLVHTAQAVRANRPRPSSAFRARLQVELADLAQSSHLAPAHGFAGTSESPATSPSFLRRRWQPVLLRFGAVCAAVLLVLGGMVAASANSQPGDFLYPVHHSAQQVGERILQISRPFLSNGLEPNSKQPDGINSGGRLLGETVRPLPSADVSERSDGQSGSNPGVSDQPVNHGASRSGAQRGVAGSAAAASATPDSGGAPDGQGPNSSQGSGNGGGVPGPAVQAPRPGSGDSTAVPPGGGTDPIGNGDEDTEIVSGPGLPTAVAGNPRGARPTRRPEPTREPRPTSKPWPTSATPWPTQRPDPTRGPRPTSSTPWPTHRPDPTREPRPTSSTPWPTPRPWPTSSTPWPTSGTAQNPAPTLNPPPTPDGGPSGKLSGRVSLSDKPLQMVVYIYPVASANTEPGRGVRYGVNTDKEGRFALELPVGLYKLKAAGSFPFLPSRWYPGVRESRDAKAVPVINGKETAGVDFKYEFYSGFVP